MHSAGLYAPVDPELAGSLIDAAGSPGLAPALLQAAQRLGSVEEIFAYRVGEAGAPEPLLSSSGLEGAEQRSREYASRFHPLDPAVSARQRARPGSGFAKRVRAADIRQREYRAICFDRPRFADKVCFGWRGQDHAYVLSFYRRRSASTADLPRLAALADVALVAIARHAKSRTAEGLPLAVRLEARLRAAYPQLSRRERQICAHTLAGWSAERIAEAFGIRPSTVLTYRQRAYQRMGFGSATAFLEGLLG